MIDINPLCPDDWQVIRRVRLQSLHESPDAFTSTYEREATFDELIWRDRATTCQWFVATEAGEAIGVAGGIDGLADDSSDRELVGMWVAPSHRGRGTARRLLEAVGVWAEGQGATMLRLGVKESNVEAHDAYLRMGLRVSRETRAAHAAPDRSVVIMVLDLEHH
jgi:GNAT superfamily N-acetyltransferase